MADAQRLDPADEILIEYVSPQGPIATHVRGSLIVSSLGLLKKLGQYDHYLSLLPAEHHDALVFALAASWVPTDIVVVHCQTCDRLELDAAQAAQIGEVMGVSIFDSFVGTMMRAVRSAGVDNAIWLALKQADRVWPRVYTGGGCTVIRRGPKDALLEAHGLAFASSRFLRTTHLAMLQGLANTLAKKAVVRPVRPRLARPHTLATAISWV